jgi:hypothetical protein
MPNLEVYNHRDGQWKRTGTVTPSYPIGCFDYKSDGTSDLLAFSCGSSISKVYLFPGVDAADLNPDTFRNGMASDPEKYRIAYLTPGRTYTTVIKPYKNSNPVAIRVKHT